MSRTFCHKRAIVESALILHARLAEAPPMLRRVLVATLLLIPASPVFAQQYENARRLGGPTSFYRPPLTDAASMKRMAERAGMPDDIRMIMRDAGIPEAADPFIAAISRGTSTRIAGNCSTAQAGEGVFECQEPVGATYEWMAYRPIIRGKRTPARRERVRWAGQRPFAAFLVRVTAGDKLYTFIVPKACANISLLSVGTSPEAVAAAAAQAAREQAAREQAARDQAAREQAAREQAAREQAARDQAAREQAARDQAAREQAAREQAAREQEARNAAQPPNAGANAAGQTTSSETPSPFFADALVGGERRNRPADLSEGKPTDYTQGSGLIGLKAGVAKKFESNWELGGAVGLGAMFLFKENTTNQWPWFATLEVNRYFGNWFVGSGFSIWDFTRSDLWTPSWDLRFGIPLGHHPKHPLQFIGEGRW